MGVLLSSGCWGNYLPGCTCGSVRLIGSLCSCRLGAQGSAALDVSEHPFLRPDAVAPNRMRCISTQPYILLHACVIYMPPPPPPTHTHPLHVHLPYTPVLREGIRESQRRSVLGEEAAEPSLTWGMGPDGTKPHLLLLHVENGRRARGGGEGGEKISGEKRRRE